MATRMSRIQPGAAEHPSAESAHRPQFLSDAELLPEPQAIRIVGVEFLERFHVCLLDGVEGRVTRRGAHVRTNVDPEHRTIALCLTSEQIVIAAPHLEILRDLDVVVPSEEHRGPERVWALVDGDEERSL